MARFLCFGDLHLGAGHDYGRDPGDRLRDQHDVLAMIVQLANENDVDAVLFAGDAFHRRRPTPAELVAFARPLVELEAPLIAITGNHDVESADLPTALEVFTNDAAHDSPGLLRLSTRPEVIQVAGVAIATLPWTPVSRLVAANGGGDHDRAHEDAAAMLIAAARGLRDQVVGPAVLMLHWSVSGASTPTGAITDDFREVVLDVDELQGLGFDAIVAGHIHKAQPLGTAVGFYTGSPAPVDFGEATVDHGVYLVELEGPGAATATFVPIASRPFVTVNVDLTREQPAGLALEQLGLDETDVIAAAVATHVPLDDAVVRIRYRATEEQARRIDWPKLKPLLADAHKIYAISGEILRAHRPRVDGVDEEMAPHAAVAAWCAANEISTMQSSLVDLTGGYLQEAGAI